MKESILKRLNKMEGGGTKKAISLGLTGVKPFVKNAASRVIGPLSLILGAKQANAAPGPFGEPLDIPMPSGKRSTDMTGNVMLPTDLPPMSSDEMSTISNQLRANMAMPLDQMQMGGIQSLPGGVAMNIPGTDAIEFMGQTHDEGGIMMDPQTEVEDGETMDQVTMKKGGKKDYFFSSYLKKGGRSYADMHKDILAMGGGQEDVDMLARLQEKAAGRDPEKVAKLGGVVEYNKGGVKAPKGFHWMRKGPGKYKLMEHGDKPFKEHEGASLVADFPIQEKHNPKQDAKMAKRKYNTGGLTQADKMKNFQKILEMDPSYSRLLDYQMLQQEGQVPIMSAEELPVTYGQGLIGPQTQLSADYMNQNVEIPEMNQGFNLREKANLFAGSFGKGYDAYLNRQQLRGDAGDVMSEEEFNQMRQQEQLSKVLRPNMPMEAKIGAAVQFLPAVTAMFTKQKDPEEFTFTPGVSSPIVTGRVKGLRYEAPTQDEARANLANEYLAQQRFLDTSGAGAATLSNRQSLFAKKLFADAKLGALEAKDQLKAEALTKQSQQKADLVNVTNELKASLANAQLAQKEAQRKDAVDNANIAQRNKREQEKILNRLSIAANLAQGIAGVTGDVLQYKADERVARATGAYGIYERDRVKNMLQGQINPETGKIYTDEEINKKVLEILS